MPALLGARGGETVLHCVCDQMGTPKVFRASMGRAAKHLWYDSFGSLYNDSMPDLHIPVGFAGGLADKDTGLVRFGYRDYDPATGRFTCPDPLGDTGGDHDLYDYCVDDPVSLVDPIGLNPFAVYQGAMFIAQQAARYAPRIAAAAQRGAQAIANGAQRAGQAIADGVTKVGNAVADGAQRLHIASQSEGKVGQAVRGVMKGAQAAEGAFTPFTGIIPESSAGKIGATIAGAYAERARIGAFAKDSLDTLTEGAKLAKQVKEEMEAKERLR